MHALFAKNKVRNARAEQLWVYDWHNMSSGTSLDRLLSAECW